MEYRLLPRHPMRFAPTLLLLAGAAQAAAPMPEEFVPGHVIVKYKRAPGSVAARVERTLAPMLHLLHAADDSDAGTRALIARLAADPAVEWVEREHVRRRSST